jgi:hypothetical protein
LAPELRRPPKGGKELVSMLAIVCANDNAYSGSAMTVEPEQNPGSLLSAIEGRKIRK